MGRQVRFRCHPADLHDLYEFISARGGLVLRQRTDRPEPVILGSLDLFSEVGPGSGREALIARSADIDRLIYKHGDTRGFWLVDKMNSPVIE